jgi:hypothetical protein
VLYLYLDSPNCTEVEAVEAGRIADKPIGWTGLGLGLDRLVDTQAAGGRWIDGYHMSLLLATTLLHRRQAVAGVLVFVFVLVLDRQWPAVAVPMHCAVQRTTNNNPTSAGATSHQPPVVPVVSGAPVAGPPAPPARAEKTAGSGYSGI